MASNDWTTMTGASALDTSNVLRGVTNGIDRPPGGGDFLYAMRSITTAQGAVNLFVSPADSVSQPNFAPMTKGGSIRGVLARGVSAGNTNFANYFFVGWQGTTVESYGYLVGLTDADPSHISVRKISSTNSLITNGLPDSAPGTSGILLRSTATFDNDTFVHVRLDMIYNTNGDVTLKVYTSDLTARPLGHASGPNWVALAGCETFVDDVVGANSGTVPYVNGRAGKGAWFRDTGRLVLFDGVEVYKQL